MDLKYPLLKSLEFLPYPEYKNSGKSLSEIQISLRQYYGPIEDQGQFGSCSAFASLQWRGALRRQAGLDWIKPSYFANYYQERAIEDTVAQDAGATISKAITVLEAYGAMPEANDPYLPEDFAKDPPNAWDPTLALFPSQVLKIDSQTILADTLDAITNGHPVLFGFTVFNGLESEQVADQGILPLPKSDEQPKGGHAVNAIGYDPTTKMILVLNQWGQNWGIKSPPEFQGCFWMPYDYYTKFTFDAFVGLPDKNKPQFKFSGFKIFQSILSKWFSLIKVVRIACP